MGSGKKNAPNVTPKIGTPDRYVSVCPNPMVAIPRDHTTEPMPVARIAENAAMLHCYVPMEVTCKTGA
jgi:hypothetical protein